MLERKGFINLLLNWHLYKKNNNAKLYRSVNPTKCEIKRGSEYFLNTLYM